MKKIWMVIGVVVLAAIVWFAFQPDTIDYVKEVNDEVTALETELAELEAAIEAGTLSPEEAAEAQVRIASRIDAVNTRVGNAQKADFTPAQRAQLKDALERMKQALTNYQPALLVVEAQVEKLPEADKQRLRRGGSVHRITQVVTEAVAEIEEAVEEVVEDYDETPLEELFEDNASSSEEQSEEWLEEQPDSDDVSESDGEMSEEEVMGDDQQIQDEVTPADGTEDSGEAEVNAEEEEMSL